MEIATSINTATLISSRESSSLSMASNTGARENKELSDMRASGHHESRRGARRGHHHHHHHATGNHHGRHRMHSMGATQMISSSSEVTQSVNDQGIQKTEQVHQSSQSGFQYRPGLGLGVFQQEIKATVSTSFGENYFSKESSYEAITTSDTPGGLAQETLVTAKLIMKANPEEGSSSMISFRQKVESSARVAIEAVPNDADVADVEDALNMVSAGLDELDAEASQVEASSASVLNVDYNSRQSTTIRIRTQEGDTVKLHLRESSSMNVGDVSVNGEHSSSALTSIDLSNHGGLMLSVEGDINENELAAIQNVFAKAQSIADEFFDGDLASAFDLADEFDFDSEQLARVKLGFNSKESINTIYSQIPVALDSAVVDLSETAAQEEPQREVVGVQTTSSDNVEVVSDEATGGVEGLVVANADVADSDAEIGAVASESSTTIDDSSFADFFALLTDFTKSVSTGFESSDSGTSSTLSYHYSQSFKFEMLKAVLNTVAPEESADVAVVASLVVDGVAAENVAVDRATEAVG